MCLSSDNYCFMVVVNNLFIMGPVIKINTYKQAKNVHSVL